MRTKTCNARDYDLHITWCTGRDHNLHVETCDVRQEGLLGICHARF